MSGGSIAGRPDMRDRVQSEEAVSDHVPLPLLTERADGVATPEPGTRVAQAVARHFDLVWRSLRRFGVSERGVDDAAQHVFMTFSEHLDSVPLERERPFLVAVAARVAANARRKVERSREILSGEVEWALSEHTPEDLLEHKQRLEELERALDALPFEQRTVFVLYEIEGWSLPEIAETLAIPLGTATSRLRRARDKFESWVEARDLGGGDP